MTSPILTHKLANGLVLLGEPTQSLESAAATLRQIIAKADPNLPLYFVGTPAKQVESFVATNRVIAVMFSIFGVVAIVLASVGIYGVMSFSVTMCSRKPGSIVLWRCSAMAAPSRFRRAPSRASRPTAPSAPEVSTARP